MEFLKPFYRWRPHPWHGLDPGPDVPDIVLAYIELTPFDLVKYEIDKETGYLRVDRPQRSSSQPPTLYGFIPRTFCGSRVQSLSPKSASGDNDPLDICVICERPINRSEIILTARVLGGIQMIDGGEADDKIIAVLLQDNIWGKLKDISELPEALVGRMRHYFQTYKLLPEAKSNIFVEKIYGAEHARKVVNAALEDYENEIGSG